MSRKEKKALLNIALGRDYLPDGMGKGGFAAAVESLARAGLVKAASDEGGSLADARLTPYGKSYLEMNPNLRNPWHWAKIATIAACVAAAASLAAIFVACSR